MTLRLHTEPGGLSPLVVAGLARNLAQLVSRRNRERPAAEAALPPGERFLQWAQTFLPRHLRCAPSAMHHWLAAELERGQQERGLLLNVVGPRGGAKSTLVTLAYVLYAYLVSPSSTHLPIFCGDIDRFRHSGSIDAGPKYTRHDTRTSQVGYASPKKAQEARKAASRFSPLPACDGAMGEKGPRPDGLLRSVE